MPTVLIRGQVTASGVPFELKGFTSGAVLEVFVEESILGRETEIPIAGLGEETEPPPPVLSAHILGMPVQATELTTITTLSAEVRDEDGNVVDLYDPDDWTWAVVSGGGSFGGPNGDHLTLPAALVTVTVRATHDEEQVSTTASVSVVSVATLTPDFFNLPSQVIAGQQTSALRSRALNSDGSTAEQIDTNWSYSIVSGVGVITGPVGNQVLVPNAGGAGQQITVRATYTGGLNVSPSFENRTTSVVAQPTGEFPPGELEPAGMTQVAAFNGSTKNWSGWSPNALWNDDTRLRVIGDITSKFGSVLEKRWYQNDSHGWYAVNARDIGNFRELYVRMVYILSPNYDFHGSGVEKLFYMRHRNSGGQIAQGVFTLGQHAGGMRLALNSLGGNGVIDGVPYASADFQSNSIGGTSRNTWYTAELLFRLNTPGNSDGTIEVRRNGVVVPNWRWLGKQMDNDLRNGNLILGGTAWDSYQFNNIETFLFWGGTGDTKNADDYMRLSEFYISGRN